MSTNPYEIDPDAIISTLAGPLAPADRAAFRAAAEDALARLPCWGEGAVYRTVAALQRSFFVPPDVRYVPNDHLRTSKLRAAPPMERDGRQRRTG